MVDQPRSPREKQRKLPANIALPEAFPGINKKAPINKPSNDKGAKENGPPDPRDAKPKQPQAKVGKNDDPKILERIKKRVDRAIKNDDDNRKAMVEDLKFFAGDQWPADILQARNTDRRPALTTNILPNFVNQVCNGQRENRPSINVSPTGDSDKEAAKMYRGLIRAIERQSKADIAYDTAFFNAVTMGVGYIRLLTDWESEESFDQSIVIKRVRNPFTVYLDPDRQEPDGADARFGIVTEIVPKDVFEEEYPNAQLVSFDKGGNEKFKSWNTDEGIRVAEYYEVVEEDATLLKLDTGATVFEEELDEFTQARINSGAVKVLDERKSFRRRVDYYKVTAIEILERSEWLGKWIPIIPVIGTEIDIEGKVRYSGVVRNAKDPQRMINYWTTSDAEVIALQPKAPWLLAEGQVEGHEREWADANRKTRPYLSYKPTDINGTPVPPPTREAPPQPSQALIEAKQGALADLQRTTGIRYDPMVQPADMRESGKMIREARRDSDIGAYHYIDNLGRSLKHLGDQMIDLIPKIYDRQRIVTILREDDTEENVRIDPIAPKGFQETQGKDGRTVKTFNPSVGKYGVTVDIGPSYATKRIEAAESMMEFIQAMPQAAAVTADLMVKNFDWEGSELISARLAALLPPQALMVGQNMGQLPPQIKALIGSQQQQIQQHQQQLMQAHKALTDKSNEQHIKREKIQRDFEAKILAVAEKSEHNAKGVKLDGLRLLLDAVREMKPEPEHDGA